MPNMSIGINNRRKKERVVCLECKDSQKVILEQIG